MGGPPNVVRGFTTPVCRHQDYNNDPDNLSEMNNTVPHKKRGTKLPLLHPAPASEKFKTFQLVHFLTVFLGEFGFKFCLKLKTLRRITSVPALPQIDPKYLPHFSHQLSNKGQLDRVVRKISLSSNLGLLWIGPRPQKQGILTKKEKKGRRRNCDPGMIVQILQERAARLLTSSLKLKGANNRKQTFWWTIDSLQETMWIDLILIKKLVPSFVCHAITYKSMLHKNNTIFPSEIKLKRT